MEARRMRAAKWFDAGETQAEVARRLGVSRESVRRWYEIWIREGKSGLRRAGRAGRKPRLESAQLREIRRALKQGPQRHGYATALWTLPRIRKLIFDITGVSYHEGHVWRLLRNLGWSCQKPTSQARERKESAIRRWIEEEWPQIKKKPVASGRL